MTFSANILEEFLHTVYEGFDTSNEIEPKMWREQLRLMNEATVQGLEQGNYRPRHNDDFLNAMRHGNEVFAAFKTHAMGEAMAKKLYDAEGNLKSFDQWVDDVASISSHHVGSWLKTEYNTAVLRTHAAADWQEFIENKDIFPNLRWMPTTSPDAEASHMAYWEKKLTLPVEHPFWAEHHPQDRWNCKCSLEATDDPASPAEVIEDMPAPQSQRGLENNPGKDGHLINDTHPYFPENCNKCPFYKKKGMKNRIKAMFFNKEKDCFNCPYIDGCMDRTKQVKILLKERAKEIRKEAEFLKETLLVNEEFGHEVKVYGTSLKEWLNQPHEQYQEKNELLLSLPQVFADAEYLGYVEDHKRRRDVKCSHVFETKIKGQSSWILVHEMDWGEYVLHSISDSEKLKTMAQK